MRDKKGGCASSLLRRGALKESELMEAIKRYLEDPTDDYAIMITGAWG